MEDSTGIERTFTSLGKDIRENIPRVKIGGNLPPVDDPFVNKVKRWLLIGLTVLIAGGALALIIKSLMGKFFG